MFVSNSSSCRPADDKEKNVRTKSSAMESPESIKMEHAELHRQLGMAAKLSGQTGKIAKEVAALLHTHFIKEEKFASPPLTLLPELARGNVTDDMKYYIPLTDTLKENWSVMLEEHKQIKQKLDLLEKTAADENHGEVVKFAESLKLHARTEEEILYPAAILIGNYLKLKHKKQ